MTATTGMTRLTAVLPTPTITALIGRGQLALVKIGGARGVLRRDLEAYLTALGDRQGVVPGIGCE